MAETLINGIHVISLGSRDPDETLEVSTLSNELGEGYFDEVLFGSETGTRSWGWNMPVLDMNTASCTLDGVNLKPAEYLFELFQRQKTRGELFALRSPVDGQYYLVRFAESNLTLKGIFTRLFTSSAMFKQVRRTGVTVFDPLAYPVETILETWSTPITGATDGNSLPSGEWPSERGTNALEASTGVTYQTDEQNGLAIVRLDDAGGADSLTENTVGFEFAEAFIVMKIRAATFSGSEAIFGDGTTELLQGAGAGTTRFANQSFTGYQYKLNGQTYAATAQAAPMNVFGVVHLRRLTPWAFNGLRFTGNVDIGEVIFCADPIKPSLAAQITEHLLTKWGI